MNAFVIKGGRVYNPLRGDWKDRDVAVENGKIISGVPRGEYQVIDAAGCVVTAGLIDYHVHYFNHGTENGINPDAASFPCGVTTAVDAGSSGAANYELYRNTVMAMSDVRIFNMLLMASGGQITDQYPERLEEQYFDKKKIKDLFARYPENLVGLKTRMSVGIIAADAAVRSLSATVELADEIGCNVSVHITNPIMDLEEIGRILRKGDVICHIYQGKGEETILDAKGNVRKGILEAREKGVIFDASNGCNNYDLEVCGQAMAQGFWPDIISSDINTSGFYLQPLHSLPRIMSKYLEFGMSLEDVLDAVTIIPARLLGRPELASMDEGTAADIGIFDIRQKRVVYRDKAGHTLEGSRVIVPQLTMKDGKIMYCQADFT